MSVWVNAALGLVTRHEFVGSMSDDFVHCGIQRCARTAKNVYFEIPGKFSIGNFPSRFFNKFRLFLVKGTDFSVGSGAGNFEKRYGPDVERVVV